MIAPGKPAGTDSRVFPRRGDRQFRDRDGVRGRGMGADLTPGPLIRACLDRQVAAQRWCRMKGPDTWDTFRPDRTAEAIGIPATCDGAGSQHCQPMRDAMQPVHAVSMADGVTIIRPQPDRPARIAGTGTIRFPSGMSSGRVRAGWSSGTASGQAHVTRSKPDGDPWQGCPVWRHACVAAHDLRWIKAGILCLWQG